MKRMIVRLAIALCIAGAVNADQTIQSVQQALQDQGFYYGSVTGEKSAETAAAIRRYQIRNGLQVTGDINQETLRSLNLSSNSASSPQPVSKPAVTQSRSVRPDDSWQPSQNPPARSLSEPGRPPETNPAFSSNAYQSARPPLTRRFVVAEAQHQLMSRGYYRGRIDGKYGPRTRLAVREFQLDSGFAPTGALGKSTLDALGLSDANLAYLEPAPGLYESRVPVWKFKHGKWKVKWKKYHRHNGHEDADEDRDGNNDDWWRGHEHDED
jgi:peptidoglycan hydrolase-like protein with peptidoglycan-binding domain